MPPINNRALLVAVLVAGAVALTALLLSIQTQGLVTHWRDYLDGLPERDREPGPD